jgi:hypothetical protein
MYSVEYSTLQAWTMKKQNKEWKETFATSLDLSFSDNHKLKCETSKKIIMIAS